MPWNTLEPHRRTLRRRLVPFVIIGLLPFGLAAIPPRPSDWSLVLVAAAVAALIAATGLFAPWDRLPRWTYVIPPLAYFGVIALLREGLGGAASGYSVLVLLPVVWVALMLGVWEVGLMVAFAAATIVAPLLVGDPDAYPTSDWRRAILVSTTAAFVGFAVNKLVRQIQQQADASQERADDLARSEATIASVMRMAHALDGDARRHACSAARELSGATFAIVAEPAAGGSLQVSAHDGFETAPPPIGRHGGCTAAFARCSRIVVLDADSDDSVSTALRKATDTQAVVFEPIIRNGRAVGVLVVGWATPFDALPASAGMALELLAAEVAAAIEREDLVSRLEHASVTDDLTGLPNRRRWEDELPRALARARRMGSPVSLVMLDLDHFKDFNDRHGHQAGDALLREASAGWQRVMRPDDLLARYGGEEFAALIFDGGLTAALATADRLRRATPGGQTCSAGVATWDRRETASELVRRADVALYAAKRLGRDRTEAARPLGLAETSFSAGAA